MSEERLQKIKGSVEFQKEMLKAHNMTALSLDEEEELIEEIERLKQEHKAIKKYVHNHTITYMDNGIKCCKPDEYFNISWVEDMLNGNFENLDVLFEDSEDNG